MSKMVCESNDVRVNRFGGTSIFFFRYKRKQIKTVCRTPEEVGKMVLWMIESRKHLDLLFDGGN